MTVSNIRGVHAFLTSTIKPSVIQNGDEKNITANVSVKSKLQHAPPGHVTFLKIIVQIPPYPGQNAVKCPTLG